MAWGIQEGIIHPPSCGFFCIATPFGLEKKRFHYPRFKWEEFELSKQLITPFGCDGLQP